MDGLFDETFLDLPTRRVAWNTKSLNESLNRLLMNNNKVQLGSLEIRLEKIYFEL